MKFSNLSLLLLTALCASADAFIAPQPFKATSSALAVSIGLGPDEQTDTAGNRELVAGVDYDIPDHDAFRTSRRTKIDEQCDEWFGYLSSWPCLRQV